MSEPGWLRAEVFWQPAEGPALLRPVRLAAGATLGDAVRASGVADVLPDEHWESDDGPLRLAVFGVGKRADARLHDGDRVDVTRALTADPKEARRARARTTARARKR